MYLYAPSCKVSRFFNIILLRFSRVEYIDFAAMYGFIGYLWDFMFSKAVIGAFLVGQSFYFWPVCFVDF